MGPSDTPSALSTAKQGQGLKSPHGGSSLHLDLWPGAEGRPQSSAGLPSPRHPDTIMSPCPDTKNRAQQDPQSWQRWDTPPHWLDMAFRQAAGRRFWDLNPNAAFRSGNAEVQGTGYPTCQSLRGLWGARRTKGGSS